jgi:hypothetical protein
VKNTIGILNHWIYRPIFLTVLILPVHECKFIFIFYCLQFLSLAFYNFHSGGLSYLWVSLSLHLFIYLLFCCELNCFPGFFLSIFVFRKTTNSYAGFVFYCLYYTEKDRKNEVYYSHGFKNIFGDFSIFSFSRSFFLFPWTFTDIDLYFLFIYQFWELKTGFCAC